MRRYQYMKKKRIKCPVCRENNANIDNVFGVLPCDACQAEQDGITTNERFEFTSESIKGERKEYQRAMLQPYIGGVLSKEYIEEYGTAKLKGVTEKDVREAKYVYGHMTRHHKRGESKK